GSASGKQANLRSRFAESAWWQPAIELAPHATQIVRVRLPDNLTRWRALVWSADSTDHFELAQATVEAMLPIELRSDAPTRLFPGDEARLSVSVRNHSDSRNRISSELVANGAGVQQQIADNGSLAATDQGLLSVTVRPDTVGTIAIEGRAHRGQDTDGIAAAVEVASPVVRTQLP